MVKILRKQDALAALQSPQPASVSFLCGDIFKVTEWVLEGSVVYASSLLFNSEMMRALVDLVAKMRPGSVFMTLKALPLDECGDLDCSHVELVFSSWYEMSWHRSKIYFYSVHSRA